MNNMNGQLITKVKTGLVRFSYANLFTPRAFAEGQEAKYSVSILIEKTDTKTISDITAAFENAKKEGVAKFGARFATMANDLFCKPGDKSGLLKDGDLDPRCNEDEANHGHYILNLKCKTAPGVLAVENGAKPLTIDQEEMFYSGCYGKASFNFFSFQKAGNTGISAGLSNVIKTMDGDNLGGRSSAVTDFADEVAGAQDELLG